MIIYNITVNIDHEVHDEWFDWMKDAHIPDVMKTGHFEDARFSKVLAEDDGGVTYSIQYLAKTKEDLDRYLEMHAPRLRDDHNKKFGGKFAAFRTLLELKHKF